MKFELEEGRIDRRTNGHGPGVDAPVMDVVDAAEASGHFRILTLALDVSGLADDLRAFGPFTIFAPLDEAFARLPRDSFDLLLKPQNRFRLIAMLTYHIVPVALKASDLAKLTSTESMSGKLLTLRVGAGDIMINDAKIVATDIAATNGVLHGIDTVLHI